LKKWRIVDLMRQQSCKEVTPWSLFSYFYFLTFHPKDTVVCVCHYAITIFKIQQKSSVNLACAEENKFMLAVHPGLLGEIIHMASTDPVPQAREHAATVIMVSRIN
jgi:hypothetical protein